MDNSEINKKIKIIRDFVPVPQPQFNGDEHAMPYVIWNLYNRVCDAMKSFIVLLDNKRYYDAFIIAGHALETCSVLSYIKDNKTKEAQLENYNKYLALSALSRLLALLEMSENLEKDVSWNAYVCVLKIFYLEGQSIVKASKNAKEKHEEVIKKINFRLGANIEKINLLRNSYKSPSIQSFITAFSNNMGNIDEGEFDLYYTKYCNYKHSNMLAPCALAGDIDLDEIDWFLNLMLGIIMYLDKSKLAPYVK